MTERSVEYPIIRDYVRTAFLEEREGRSLSKRQQRLASFVARCIAIWSVKRGERPEELETLDSVITKAGYGVVGREWVHRRAEQLLPGWMEAKRVAGVLRGEASVTVPQDELWWREFHGRVARKQYLGE